MDDAMLREVFYGVVGLGAVCFCLSGFLTRVAGHFEEDNKFLELKQLGPVVWGASRFSQGHQTYTGFVTLGRLRLVRRDFGREHLVSLGFAEKDAPGVEGQAMGVFHMRVAPDALKGSFWPYRFREVSGGLRAQGLGPPQPRVWRRSTTSAPPTK